MAPTLIMMFLNGNRKGLCLSVSASKPIILGRKGSGADVPLPDPALSRLHCRIQALGALFTVTDLDSANGTLVNGAPLHPHAPCPLHRGDILEIGETRLRVTDDGQPKTEASPKRSTSLLRRTRSLPGSNSSALPPQPPR